MKKVIFILLIIASIFGGCKKKYPEGPLISLSSSWGRLKGQHTITKYTINGIDSLNLFYDSLALQQFFYKNTIDGEDYWQIKGNRKDGKEVDLTWSVSLINHNKILKIISNQETTFNIWGTGPFSTKHFLPWNYEWEILKLKANDIIMKTTFNGKEYIIELN